MTMVQSVSRVHIMLLLLLHKALVILEHITKRHQHGYVCANAEAMRRFGMSYLLMLKTLPLRKAKLFQEKNLELQHSMLEYNAIIPCQSWQNHRVQLARSCILPCIFLYRLRVFQALCFWNREGEVFLHLNKQTVFVRSPTLLKSTSQN